MTTTPEPNASSTARKLILPKANVPVKPDANASSTPGVSGDSASAASSDIASNAADAPTPPESALRPEREQTLRNPANLGKVPSLAQDQMYGYGTKVPNYDAEVERLLEEAMGGISDKELYGETRPARGKKGAPQGPVKGKVYRVHGQDVFVELPGGRSQGVLSLQNFPEGPPEPGTELEVHIERTDADGLVLLNLRGAAVETDWSSVRVGLIVEARVIGTNKGGLSVDVNGIRGFLPISQIDMYRVENPESYINQKLLVLVSEVDREDRNLVVSRRALLEQERQKLQEKFWQEIEVGQVREGIVRSLRDFGAFVDLGGADGLLHISELAWARVNEVGALLQVGQQVKVQVLKLDREGKKISLGMRQLMASPWDDVAVRFAPGTLVDGTVTKLKEFGAFVELEPGLEGLVHISELAPQRVYRVRDVVSEGQAVTVKVLNIDRESRRISLSLKGAREEKVETAPTGEETAEESASVSAKPKKPLNIELRGGVGNKVQLPKKKPS